MWQITGLLNAENFLYPSILTYLDIFLWASLFDQWEVHCLIFLKFWQFFQLYLTVKFNLHFYFWPLWKTGIKLDLLLLRNYKNGWNIWHNYSQMLDNEQCRTVIPMRMETNEVNPMIAQISAWRHSKNHDARMGCPCRIRHSCWVE